MGLFKKAVAAASGKMSPPGSLFNYNPLGHYRNNSVNYDPWAGMNWQQVDAPLTGGFTTNTVFWSQQ